jgi:hypothetical protein
MAKRMWLVRRKMRPTTSPDPFLPNTTRVAGRGLFFIKRDVQRLRARPGQLFGEPDGGNHAGRMGNAATGDVVSGAVVR